MSEQGKYFSVEDRTALFNQAFAKTKKDLPKPLSGNSWRFNMEKIKSLSFSEKLKLQELFDSGVPYYELDSWLLDGGFIKLSKEEEARQKKLTTETGLTRSERKEAFDVFRAETLGIVEMFNRDILKGSDVLKNEFQFACDRFGKTEVLNALVGIDKEAGEYFKGLAKADEREAEAAKIQELQAQKKKDIEDEIAEVQQQIEDLKAQENGMAQVPTDFLRNELIRCASFETRANADND